MGAPSDKVGRALSDAMAALNTADALHRQQAPGDWVEMYHEGDAIGSAVAAAVAGWSVSTVLRRCEEAQAAGFPIGVQLIAGGSWLISTRRLLVWIERTEKLPARLEAESRLAKHLANRQIAVQQMAVMTAVRQNDAISDGPPSNRSIPG